MEDPILDKSKQFNLCKARLTLGALVFACINICKAKKYISRVFIFSNC